MDSVCFGKNICFESKRLMYRGISSSDSEKLVRWRSRKDVYDNTFNARAITPDEHQEWFERYMKNKQSLRLVITEKESGTDIGMVGGEYNDTSFEISYYIGEPDFRGRGYASEAINAFIECISTNTSINVFKAKVIPSNAPSINCLIKSGFSVSFERDGELLFERRIS